jgi:hypothetical protein
MDRHKVWRIVRNNHAELSEGAPDGYRAVVDVFVVGRPGPIRLDVIQTTRDPNFPWVSWYQKAPIRISRDLRGGFLSQSNMSSGSRSTSNR